MSKLAAEYYIYLRRLVRPFISPIDLEEILAGIFVLFYAYILYYLFIVNRKKKWGASQHYIFWFIIVGFPVVLMITDWCAGIYGGRSTGSYKYVTAYFEYLGYGILSLIGLWIYCIVTNFLGIQITFSPFSIFPNDPSSPDYYRSHNPNVINLYGKEVDISDKIVETDMFNKPKVILVDGVYYKYDMGSWSRIY